MKLSKRNQLSKRAEIDNGVDEEVEQVRELLRNKTEEEKWDTFERLVRRLETFKLSKKQFEDLKATIEKLIWGSINNYKN